MKAIIILCTLGMWFVSGCSDTSVTPQKEPLPRCYFRADVINPENGNAEHWNVTDADKLKFYYGYDMDGGSYIMIWQKSAYIHIEFDEIKNNNNFTGVCTLQNSSFRPRFNEFYTQVNFLYERIVITTNTESYIEGTFKSLTFDLSFPYPLAIRNGEFLIWK